MRSRFTAYATGDADHLRATWDPDTRPLEISIDPTIKWLRLEVIATGQRGTQATVEFRAYYEVGPTEGSQHEVSRFVRTETGWLYLDGA
jgi:SEC-C motif-containing protein